MTEGRRPVIASPPPLWAQRLTSSASGHVSRQFLAICSRGPQIRIFDPAALQTAHSPQRLDCLAGHIGFEPANPSASYLIGIA
jgi:hypothetical protein